MSKELEYAPAFILHSRPFKENQLLLEVLVAGEGRMSIIGYKGSKKNTAKTALFRPFRPLIIQFKKSSGLRSLKSIDENQALARQIPDLGGKALFCGFYINELVCRLCKADEDYPELYPLYVYALKQLAKDSGSQSIEWVLRQFEHRLISMLGYGISFSYECEHGIAIAEGANYELRPDKGFVLSSPKPNSILGADILRLGRQLEHEFEETNSESLNDDAFEERKQTLRLAKAIMRQCLHIHLGDKPLKSRELFRK